MHDAAAVGDHLRSLVRGSPVRIIGRPLKALLLCAAALVIAGCSPFGPQTSDTGGTGSEIVGKSEYPDSTGQPKALAVFSTSAGAGLPVILGRVFAYPRTFIPDTSWATTAAPPKAGTDDTGAFRILDAPRGTVVVEVNDGGGMGRAATIDVTQDSTVYDIGIIVVQRTGEIRIQAQTSLPGRVRFYVGVEGTRLIVRGSQTGVDVVLGDVPSGITHTVNIRVYEPVPMQVDFPNVTVSPGLATVLQTLQIQ